MAKRFSKIAILLMLVLALLVPMMVMSVGAENTEIVFELGANGSASHADGSSNTSYGETVDGYTLSITGGTSMYTGARDAKGNSCIKFGTSSKTGSMAFTVPDDVTSVILCVGKYKANTSKITVNGTEYELAKSSNDGAYDEITVDTNTTKTVSFATVSGGVRAMLDSITYVIAGGTTDCKHSNTTIETVDATCTVAGSTTVTCKDCSKTVSTEEIPTTDHAYVNGVCSGCGQTEPVEVDYSGKYYIAAKRSNSNYFYMTSDLGVSSTERYQAKTTDLQVLPEEISSIEEACVFEIIKNDDGTYAIYAVVEKMYLDWSSGNSGTLIDEKSDALKLTITESNGVFQIAATGESEDIFLALNTTAAYFAWYKSSSNQIDTLSLVPVVEGSTSCQHNNKTTTTIDATCTEDGSVTVTCDDCGHIISSTSNAALGHSWDDGEVTTKPTCTEDGVKTYTCTVCGEPETEVISASGHNFVDEVCTECGEKEVNYSGRYYIATIRSSGNYWYMTSDLGTASTKRYQAADSGLTELPKYVEVNDGYVFVLEKNDNGTYSIYAEGVDGDNYLGWTSGNSGTLVAKEDALELTVDVKEDGLYNFHFTASDAERYLALNGNSGNNYFAWYKSGQKQDLALIAVHDHVYGDNGKCECGEYDPAMDHITGAALSIGKDLSVMYHVLLANGNDGKYSMVFTMNGVETVVDAVEEIGGKYYFRFKGIAPQMMGENISAELLYDGELVAEKAEYSVLEYCNYYLSGDGAAECSTELAQLLKNLLAYGAEAQKYTNTNTDKLVNAGIDSATASLPTEEDEKVNTKEEGVDGYIASAGVVFSHDIKIFFTFKNLSEDVSVKLNGEEISIEGDKYYTDGISALDFNEFITLEFVVDGKTVQTVKYSVNAYVHAIYNNDTMGALSIALYNYGLAAEAYDSSITGN